MWFVNILIVVQSTIWQILNNETHVYLCFGIESFLRGEDIHGSFFRRLRGNVVSVNLRITVSWLKTEKDAELTGDHGEKKEEIMENFINNAPFALVLVALVIGIVLLIKRDDYIM